MASMAFRSLQRVLRRSWTSRTYLPCGVLSGSDILDQPSRGEPAFPLSSLLQSTRTSVSAYSSAGPAPHDYATNVHSYNNLISAINYKKRHFLVRDVYEDMLLDGVQPIRDTFYLLITGCMKGSRLQDVMYFFDEMKAMGITPDVSVYNCVIAACGKSHQIDRAFQVAEEMEAFGIQPRHRTFLALLRACAVAGRVDEAYGVVMRMAANGLTLDKHCYAALITAHKNARPINNDTVEKIIFDLLEQSKLPSAEDHMAAAATGEAEPEQDYEDVLLNFWSDEVQSKRGFINHRLTVYHAAVSALQELGKQESMKTVLHMIEEDGHETDAYCTVQLIQCYISEGDFERACAEYKKFLAAGRRPTLDLYVTLIEGALSYPSPENSLMAQKLLKEFVKKGYFLNSKMGSDLLHKACLDNVRDIGTANLIWDIMMDRQIRLPGKFTMEYYRALEKSNIPKDDPRRVALRQLLDESHRFFKGSSGDVKAPRASDLPAPTNLESEVQTTSTGESSSEIGAATIDQDAVRDEPQLESVVGNEPQSDSVVGDKCEPNHIVVDEPHPTSELHSLYEDQSEINPGEPAR